ncbi:MAG: PA-phosphatase, partial [Vicinamibacterales bacterium]
MRRVLTAVALVAALVGNPVAARADVVLDWNGIAVATLVSQGASPFAQARFMAITQLAVFEAVNAITGDYQPYLGTVVAPVGASADAAAIAAAYGVLKNYFPAAANLTPAYDAAMAAIPDSPAKFGGIAAGQAAAAQMIAARIGDGSAPPQFYMPTSTDPGVWQKTPSCPAAGGVNFQWQNMTPFGVPSVPGSQAWIAQFALDPPPALTSSRYAKDYNEVKRVGSVSSTLAERPQDRADVAR